MGTTLLKHGSDEAGASELADTLICFRDLIGTGAMTVRAGHISAYQPELKPMRGSPQTLLGVRLLLFGGASLLLQQVSVEVVENALDAFYGRDAFKALFIPTNAANGAKVRVHHIGAIEGPQRNLTLHLFGGHTLGYFGELEPLSARLTPNPLVTVKQEPAPDRPAPVVLRGTVPEPAAPTTLYEQSRQQRRARFESLKSEFAD